MVRRSSLLAPSPMRDTARRRSGSADNRPSSSASTSTPKKTAAVRPETPGHSPARPVYISSEDESHTSGNTYYTCEEGDENDDSDYAFKELRTPRRAGGTSRPRPKSEKGPRVRPPQTPVNSRPVPTQTVTAPEMRRKPKLDDSHETSTPCKPKYQPPCGRKAYVQFKSYCKHMRDCKLCQSAQENETLEEETSIDKEGSSREQDVVGGEAPEYETKSTENNNRGEDEASEMRRKTKVVQRAIAQSAQEIHAKLITMICKNITEEEEEGWIYLAHSTDEHTRGLVKVGFTNDWEKRKAQFKSKCGQEMTVVELFGPITCIARIEQLVKADLSHLQEPWKCICRTSHREWFRVDKDFAIATVKSWIDWLEQEPYGTDLELKPLWRHLIRKHRRPTEKFDHHDHDARHGYWRSVLLTPSEDEIERFGEKEMQVAPAKQQDDWKKGATSSLDLEGVTQTLGAMMKPANSMHFMNCNFKVKVVVKAIK